MTSQPTPTKPTKALVSALITLAAMILQGVSGGESWWVAVLTALGVSGVSGSLVYGVTNAPRNPRPPA